MKMIMDVKLVTFVLVQIGLGLTPRQQCIEGRL